MALLKVDQITDSAGTGKPDFINGFKSTATKSEIWMEVGNGHGSTNTTIRRFTNSIKNTGSDITYADSATLGASFTINAAGLYAITYSDYYGSSDAVHGMSINSTEITTSIGSIASANRLGITVSPAANIVSSAVFVGWLAASDVVRAHTSGVQNGNNVRVFFKIAKLIG